MDKKKHFSNIYDKHVTKIYRFVYLKVGSPETAEDLSSEVFMRAWSSFAKSSIKNIQAFLYGIARNVVADYYRKKGKVQFVSIEETVIVSPESLEEQASVKLDIENIQKVLKELPDDHQDLIIWRYIDELSVPEIMQITGKSEDSVRVGIHRALRALKDKLPLINAD